MDWNGENSVVIRHEQEERRQERIEREQEAEELEPPACPKCGEPVRLFEGMSICSSCGRTWGPTVCR